MDFILGIFTGATLVVLLGIYLNERNKKHEKAKSAGHPPGTVGIYINGKLAATGTPMAWNDPQIRRDYTPLEQQLQDAIESEDWETAARLRDLINKK